MFIDWIKSSGRSFALVEEMKTDFDLKSIDAIDGFGTRDLLLVDI